MNKITLFLTIFSILIITQNAQAQTVTSSFYTIESAQKSGDLGIMANGKKMINNDLTCASWDYPFNTVLKITNLKNGKAVFVTVTDRGPAKRLYNKGRKIDLSIGAFSQIADIKEGIIKIKIEKLNNGGLNYANTNKREKNYLSRVRTNRGKRGCYFYL